MSVRRLGFVAWLALLPFSSSADVLACSPAEANTTPIAICAAAMGGCSLAQRYASNSYTGFLQSKSCDMIVSEIAGEKYDLDDFLGSALVDLLDYLGDEHAKEGNTITSWVSRIAANGFRAVQFANCIDYARASCTARYMSLAKRQKAVNVRSIRDVVETYYGALTEGDAPVATSLRADNTEKFMPLFSKRSHIYKVADITTIRCEESSCRSSADVIANSRQDATQERWLLTIDTVQAADGRWLINRISGGEAYGQLVAVLRNYFQAITDSNIDLAASYFKEVPPGYKEMAATRVGKASHSLKSVRLLEFSQLEAYLLITKRVHSFVDSSQPEDQQYISYLLNDAGKWKIGGFVPYEEPVVK